VLAAPTPRVRNVVESSSEGTRAASGAAAPDNGGVVADRHKVGRNEPCPCGSGLKYKRCHGRFE
jgi:preprotein translocase subunit SecA